MALLQVGEISELATFVVSLVPAPAGLRLSTTPPPVCLFSLINSTTTRHRFVVREDTPHKI